MNLSGTFTTAAAGPALQLLPGESATYSTTVDAAETFSGKVQLQRSRNGGASWEAVLELDGTDVALDDATGSVSGTVTNETTAREHYRFVNLEESADDEMDYTLADAVDAERSIYNKRGQLVATVNDDGTVTIPLASIGNLATLLAAVINDLPTADPAVAGALWLDTGVLTVSAG